MESIEDKLIRKLRQQDFNVAHEAAKKELSENSLAQVGWTFDELRAAVIKAGWSPTGSSLCDTTYYELVKRVKIRNIILNCGWTQQFKLEI